MISEQLKQHLLTELKQQYAFEHSTLAITRVSGGSINDTFRVIAGNSLSFFFKTNSASRFPLLFEKEESGLSFIAKQECIRTPAVVVCNVVENLQVLIMEWIDPANKTRKFWQFFGEQLARLHRVTAERFGFYQDNYMGALPQANSVNDSWTEFFIQSRLTPQIDLALQKKLLPGNIVARFEKLFKLLPTIFDEEKPSLLHGDLWSGNFICDKNEQPVLIDPSVYFGHRSVDVGMTTLFGGFDNSFYDSYHYHFPLPTNHTDQWQICNLYPLLIHLNLFGISYLQDIELILKKFTN